MKTNLLFYLIGSFLIFSNTSYAANAKNDRAQEQAAGSKIQIVCTPELESLVAGWVSSYKETQAHQDFVINSNADRVSEGSINFFTGYKPLAGSETLTDRLIVGHEIIVPVTNSRNPMMERLNKEGITAGDFSHILAAGASWDKVKKEGVQQPIRVYVADYPQLTARLAEYGGISETMISAEKAASSEALLSVIRTDIHAVGFLRLADVLTAQNNEFAEGISIIPIDKNGNGQIDRFENIYATPEELVRGAWIGKYPRKLCCEVFAAVASLPVDKASNDFLEWVIADGQQFVSSMGFSSLSTREKTAGILALRPSPPSDVTPAAPVVPHLWVMAGIALAFMVLLTFMVRAGLRHRSGIQSEDIEITSALNVNSILAPAGLFYDKTHTWAFMEQNGFVKIGVDDFLPHVTGRLSQIKMKARGEKIRKGEKILTLIREGKQLDIYSPVTGVIKEQNNLLNIEPSQINTDPYAAGWVYQVEPANWLRETKFMFMADSFRDWLEDEFVRLKDFLAASANSNSVVYNHIVLQDGGELTDNVLANLEPKVWEDFQTQFIDTSR